MLNACATNFGNANIGSGRMVTVTWTKDGAALDVAGKADYSFNDVTDELTIINYDAFAHNGTYDCVVDYDDGLPPAGKRRKRAVVATVSRSTVVSIDGRWVINDQLIGGSAGEARSWKEFMHM